MFMGPSVLREVIECAELCPIKGLFSFSNYFGEIDAYYHQTLGAEIGVSTGWKAMDDLYNVRLLLFFIKLKTTSVFLYV